MQDAEIALLIQSIKRSSHKGHFKACFVVSCVSPYFCSGMVTWFYPEAKQPNLDGAEGITMLKPLVCLKPNAAPSRKTLKELQ